MHGYLTVEVADLHGWASQVARAGGDCAYLADYVATHVPDGDFGMVLHLIQADYERLSMRLRETFEADARVLRDVGERLDRCAGRFAMTDACVARDLGVQVAVAEAPPAAFRDVRDAMPPLPERCLMELPRVHLLWGYSELAGLVASAGGPDVRREIVDPISGDVAKALTQAVAWEHVSASLDAVHDNLAFGAAAVTTSWSGLAADSAHDHVGQLTETLRSHSYICLQVAGHLRDAVGVAVDVAQVAVDMVQIAITALIAGVGLAYVPIFGLVHGIARVRQVIELLWDLRKVLAFFAAVLMALRDCLIALLRLLDAEPLPRLVGGTA